MMRSLLMAAAATSCCAMAAGVGRGAAPVVFLPNHGQAPPEARFLARSAHATAYFLPGEAAFQVRGTTLRVQFEGAEPGSRVEGGERLSGTANFLIGAEQEWRVDVPIYGEITYRGLYPGIDLVYRAGGRSLKSEFVVAPGADASRIRMRYHGTGALSLAPDGALVIPVGSSELREESPRIYQQYGRKRVRIGGRFLVIGNTVEFSIDEYDRSAPLVIDPLLYSTLLGGASSDAAMAVAVDATGSAYVAGFTASYDFPTANPEQSFDAGGNDVFVAKLNPAGNGLVYCTYIGGSGDDRAYGLAVGADGSAYITGVTASKNFPVPNALQSKLAGAKNAFVLKLNPAGNSLAFSTYLGGTGSDTANAIAVDTAGNAYIAGDTTSPNFPVTGLQTAKRGGQDGFVAKLSGDGSRLLYGTYLGGTYDDHAAAIAVDSSGTAYITGSTYSSDFPLAQAWQSHIAGGQDAFVARLSSDGGSLLFSTYLGGAGGELGYPESGQGIALDSQGNAYVTGSTPSADFPVLQPAQPSRRGSLDAFAAKLAPSGTLVYSTFLGGTGLETGNAIAVDATGAAYIAGQTYSTDLPAVNPFQSTSGGGYDAFLAKLAPTGDSVQLLSYLGGNGSDTATSIALDSSANVYMAGWTLSTNFPVLNGYQAVNAGTYGAFVSKIGTAPTGPPEATSVTPATGSGSSQTFAFQFFDPRGYAAITTVSMVINSSTSGTTSCYLYYVQASNALYLANDAGTAWMSPLTPGQSGTSQNSQCRVDAATSSYSAGGNNLTVNVSLTFLPAYNGAKNIYMLVYDGQNSGWQQKGTFTVNAVTSFGPVSVTPSSGSGGSQAFSFVFSDPKGASSIYSASMLVGSSAAAASSCYLYFTPASNAIYLANDAGTAWLAPVVLGQSGTLQNSQCSVNTTASSSSISGTGLTVNLTLTFLPAYNGAKNIYMLLYDGQNSGWVQKGTWTVSASAGTLAPLSVTPASGSGGSQAFAFQFSDPKGGQSVYSASIVIGANASGVGSCYLFYLRSANSLYLANDGGTAWLAPVVLGQSGTLQNSQCSVNTTTSSSAVSGTTLTLNLAISFLNAFNGDKKVYMEVYDGQDSGWQQKGTWTVNAVPLMGPVSVTPSSGSGNSQAFAFAFFEPNGASAISSASIIIGSNLSGSGSCYLYYAPSANSIYLANDAGTAWLTPVVLGPGGALQNSQCSVNPSTSSASASGNNLTLSLSLTFPSTGSGAKKIYMMLYDGQSSGWVLKGTWTVP